MSTADELYAVAKAALPGWFFGPKEVAHLRAVAELLAPVFDLAKARVEGTFVLTAPTEWLEQHAKDRGTRRQANESDAALADRLRHAEDAVTPVALEAAANKILAADGVAGVAHVLELRQQKRLFLTRHYGLTRGWRMGPSNPSGDWIIVVLPYGTSAATAASVAEAMRRYKAGGVRVVVEVRGVP